MRAMTRMQVHKPRNTSRSKVEERRFTYRRFALASPGLSNFDSTSLRFFGTYVWLKNPPNPLSASWRLGPTIDFHKDLFRPRAIL